METVKDFYGTCVSYVFGMKSRLEAIKILLSTVNKLRKSKKTMVWLEIIVKESES